MNVQMYINSAFLFMAKQSRVYSHALSEGLWIFMTLKMIKQLLKMNEQIYIVFCGGFSLFILSVFLLLNSNFIHFGV